VTLDDFIAAVNANLFLGEFSFAENQFNPRPGKEVEFADHVVWLHDDVIIFQLKQRDEPTESPEIEEKWFRNKVLRKATKQIRGTLDYLAKHDRITLTNQRGHDIHVRKSAIGRLSKVIVYLSGDALPDDRLRMRSYTSSTAGLIHLIPLHDYLGMCRVLVTPADIADYLEFRELTLSKWNDSPISEQALTGQQPSPCHISG